MSAYKDILFICFMEHAKRLIDDMKFPVNEYDSFDNFKRLYACFTPDEWLDVNNLFTVTLYIAEKRPDLVDIGTRINVQVNLFLRTIKTFSDIPINKNDIGCFALTESNAGVLSGLVVDTKFEELESGDYILNSNDSSKRWISQGMFANKSLVFASNIKNYRDCRIFLIELPCDGVTRTRMMNSGMDVAKVLDLAEIQYTNLRIDKSCVLEKTVPLSRKELLSGIFYGRLCLAEVVMTSTTAFIEHVYNNVKDIEKFKPIGHYQYICNVKRDLELIRDDLISQRNVILETENVFLINLYKVYCVELAIEVYNKLHMMFGTHAFGFGLKYETLLLNKIAEGDTSVLKLDVIKEYWDTGGSLSWRHYMGLMYNYNRQKEYVMENKDSIFEYIVEHVVLKKLK